MRFTLVIVSALATIAAPANASDWWFVDVAGNKPNRIVVYMDKESIIKGSTLKVWMQSYYENQSDNIASSKELMQVDCSNQSYRFLSWINYDASGNVLGSDTKSEYAVKYLPAAPDTVAASELKFACGLSDGAVQIGAIPNIWVAGTAALKFLDEINKHP